MRMDDVHWLHVFAQYDCHAPAALIGNRNALLALRDAIDRALTSWTEETPSFCAADGEEYSLNIIPTRLMKRLGEPPYIRDLAYKMHVSDMNMKAKWQKSSVLGRPK